MDYKDTVAFVDEASPDAVAKWYREIREISSRSRVE